jgi:hypothetical protein
VKKLICHLLIVCLALMSGAVAAHATYEAAHDLGHAVAHAHVGEIGDAGSDQASHADADHPDTCNQSHCGHGHNTGLFTTFKACPKAQAASNAPLARNIWASSTIHNNIERPKWQVTTPAVVSLLI